jgi:hypothetical protein
MNNSSLEVSQVVGRFSRVYLGDSLIQRIELDMVHARITFLCNSALILREGQNADIFNPEQRHQPAQMTFDGVKSISCPEGRFYLNSTIVDFGANPADDEGLIEFRMQLTGGFDNDSFMRSLIIVARDFSLVTAQ